MNTKLLASIAVFALLTSVVVASTHLAYADEAKKDAAKAKAEEMKAKKDAKAAELKAKKDAKAAELKAKKDAKAEEIKTKVAEKKDAKPTSTGSTIEIAKGSSTPGCETTSSCYLPSSTTVTTGTKVMWKNTDSAAHTVTSGKDMTSDGTFDSGMILAGKTFSYTFSSAGTYNYFCAVHPWMVGTVTVN